MNCILYNCKVYPQYRVARRPTTVVITGSKISALGNGLTRIRQTYPRHRMINLSGKTVIPGLVDSHTHFYYWVRTLGAVHLDSTESFEEALSEIRRFVAANSKNDWIVGDGWPPDRWKSHYLPNRYELDRVTGGKPAALYSKDQHMVWVNSRALRLAGINKGTPDPAGGKINRDPVSGEPTGILREGPAISQVMRLIKHLDQAEIRSLWKKASRIARGRGVTGFHSFDDPAGYRFFESLHAEKKLGFRVDYYFPVAVLDELIDKGIYSGLGDQVLRVGGVKIFSDGSLGSQTAYMKKPYKGSKSRGLEVTNPKDLQRQIGLASRNNLACAIHAIGDQAVSNVIDALEKSGGKKNIRHRIEHLQIISRSDILRLKRTGAVASMQPSHCPSDRKLVAAYWGRRGRNAYIFKTLLKNNIPLAFGSDCPIEPLDPIAGINAAVNRTAADERGGRFYPEECLSASQAVHKFTSGPAHAVARENYVGKIKPGYVADLAILEQNIFKIAPSKIYQTGVAATIFDGRAVYDNGVFS